MSEAIKTDLWLQMISLGVDTIFQHLQITSLGVNTIFANAMFQLNCGCCRASAVAWVELSCFMPHGPADTVDACNKENLMQQEINEERFFT